MIPESKVIRSNLISPSPGSYLNLLAQLLAQLSTRTPGRVHRGTRSAPSRRAPILRCRTAAVQLAQPAIEDHPVSQMSPRLEGTPGDSSRLETGTRQRIDGGNPRKSCAITSYEMHRNGFDSRRLHHSSRNSKS